MAALSGAQAGSQVDLPFLQVVPPVLTVSSLQMHHSADKRDNVQSNYLIIEQGVMQQVHLPSGAPLSPKGKCLAQPLLPSPHSACANTFCRQCGKGINCKSRMLEQLKQNRMWII